MLAGPLLGAVAVNFHDGSDPGGVIQGACLEYGDGIHSRGFAADGRPATRTEITVQGLSAVSRIHVGVKWYPKTGQVVKL